MELTINNGFAFSELNSDELFNINGGSFFSVSSVFIGSTLIAHAPLVGALCFAGGLAPVIAVGFAVVAVGAGIGVVAQGLDR